MATRKPTTLRQRILSYLNRRSTPATTSQVVAGVKNQNRKASLIINEESVKRTLRDMWYDFSVNKSRKGRERTWESGDLS